MAASKFNAVALLLACAMLVGLLASGVEADSFNRGLLACSAVIAGGGFLSVLVLMVIAAISRIHR